MRTLRNISFAFLLAVVWLSFGQSKLHASLQECYSEGQNNWEAHFGGYEWDTEAGVNSFCNGAIALGCEDMCNDYCDYYGTGHSEIPDCEITPLSGGCGANAPCRWTADVTCTCGT